MRCLKSTTTKKGRKMLVKFYLYRYIRHPADLLIEKKRVCFNSFLKKDNQSMH